VRYYDISLNLSPDTVRWVVAPPLEVHERRTRNSDLLKRRDFAPDFVAFSVEAARALVARGVRLVGLDYLSVAHADTQVPVHRAFLDHGVVLLEGIGAPCRAVLRDLGA
jgi:kynurenine formamidase